MGLHSFHLKWVAVLTMLIDHIGAVLFPGQMEFRIIGRIAFPIYCFLIVEGYTHTRDVQAYLKRLGIFALLSEIPYDLAFHGSLWDGSGQNVFLTLVLGVFMMDIIDKTDFWVGKALELFLVAGAAEFLNTDYGGKGIFLIFIYYALQNYRGAKLLAGGAWNFLYGLGAVQNFGVLASVPLVFYNGQRGRGMKYFFYFFYPCHLLVLYGIKYVLESGL